MGPEPPNPNLWSFISISSRPVKAACLASGPTPAASKTSLNGTPPHWVLPIAPALQGTSPGTGATSMRSWRRLPAHCRVAVTMLLEKFSRISQSERCSCCWTIPVTERRYRPASISGIEPWLRTKKSSVGVVKLRRRSCGGDSALSGYSVRVIISGCLLGGFVIVRSLL